MNERSTMPDRCRCTNGVKTS